MSRPPAAEETIFSAPPARRIGRGTRLNDLYEIDELVATGGMGEVYRGHAIETGDTVAIKTIKPEFAGSGSALALFRKEASALHNLYHEAIIRYYVFSIDKPLGLPYLAMEFVSGEALSDIAARGPLPVEAVDTLRRRLASGLHAAHALGIIHRDVSPDNVILPGGDPARAKIIDFGIARSSLGGATVIGDGFAGKYGYVSPEQLGLYGADVTPRSDIYSLGLVLAEAALGRRLDMGQNPVDVVEKRRRVPDLAGLDARLRSLLELMLQPEPGHRIGSMAEVAAWTGPVALDRKAARTAAKTAAKAAQATTRAAGPPPAAKATGPRQSGGARIPIVAGAAVALLALLGGGAYLVLQPSGSDTTEIAANGRLEEQAAPAPVPVPDAKPIPPPTPQPNPTPVEPPPKRVEKEAEPTPAPRPTPQPTPPVPAPLPPQPTPPVVADDAAVGPKPGPKPSPIEQVANYIRDYRGGDCFYLSTVSVAAHEAAIEAYGSAAPSVAAFDAAFTSAFGFDAQIQMRQVTDAQCGVVDALAQQAGQRRQRLPKLALARDRLRSGEELSGTLDLADDGNAELFLVDDEGEVHSLARNAKRTGRRLSFSLRLQAPGPAKPQLVVGVTSTEPLTFLKSRSGTRANDLFRTIADEVARPSSPAGVAVRYVKLGE